MKKINKKGITLVELLAMLVIIIFIFLIVSPKIMKIIYKSKKNAFLETAEEIVNTSEHYWLNSERVIKDGEEIDVQQLELENKKKLTGKIIRKGGSFYLNQLSNGTYCISGTIGNFTDIYNADECSKISITEPNITNFNLSSTTNSITATLTASDTNSKITKVCYYLYDENQEKIEEKCFDISNQNQYEGTYTFQNLNSQTKYYSKTVVYNESIIEEYNKKISDIKEIETT